MDVFRELAVMTDIEAETCLNGVMKGFAASSPSYDALAPQPERLRDALQSIAAEAGLSAPALAEPQAGLRPKAIRLILTEMASDDETRERLEAWLESARPTLIEPITTAIVLAGILLVLSTSVDINYERKNGKSNIKVAIKRKPTTERLLSKFFGLFSGGLTGT